MIDPTLDVQRIDIWLWHARIYKTRSISTHFVCQNIFRLNSYPISKPACKVMIDDVLTFPWNDKVRVIKILNLTKQRVAGKHISLIYQEILENS